MIDKDVIKKILDDVIQEISEQDSIMSSDNESVWGDYVDHVINGSSLVEDILFSYIDACLYNRLEKLSSGEQEELWWGTKPGKELHFEIEWAQEHHPEKTEEFGTPTSEEMYDDLVVFLRDELYLRAESEWIEKGANF